MSIDCDFLEKYRVKRRGTKRKEALNMDDVP
jgi:hypothetical protein